MVYMKLFVLKQLIIPYDVIIFSIFLETIDMKKTLKFIRSSVLSYLLSLLNRLDGAVNGENFDFLLLLFHDIKTLLRYTQMCHSILK